jgi:hypothetical protein
LRCLTPSRRSMRADHLSQVRWFLDVYITSSLQRYQMCLWNLRDVLHTWKTFRLLVFQQDVYLLLVFASRRTPYQLYCI